MFSRKARKTYVHKDFYFSLFSPTSLSSSFSFSLFSLPYLPVAPLSFCLFSFFRFAFLVRSLSSPFFAFFFFSFFISKASIKRETDIYPARSPLRGRDDDLFTIIFYAHENFSSLFSYIFAIFFFFLKSFTSLRMLLLVDTLRFYRKYCSSSSKVLSIRSFV